MKIKLSFFVLFLVNTLWATAQETEVIVRARAKDAKYIGNSIGGAYVIIKDKLTGRVLGEGKTDGNTGNTQQLLQTPLNRNQATVDLQTSKFLAKIHLSEPVFVEVEVIAPFQYKNAQIKASTELWLIPGKHILGEGIILEIPGFMVDILKPTTHQYLKPSNAPLLIQTNVVMMCGCPITKGGVWNSDEMEVKGILKKDGKLIKESVLSLVSENLFETSVEMKETGYYELTVYAYNPVTGNTGVDKVNYVIRD